MPLVYMYIPCIYHVYTSQSVIYQLYTRHIHCIYYIVYTLYIHHIYNTYGINHGLYISSIYHVYTLYIHAIQSRYLCDIQCIYMVHTQYIMRVYSVDTRLDPVAALAPGQFIVSLPLCLGLFLTSTVSPTYFPGIHVIIFLIL